MHPLLKKTLNINSRIENLVNKLAWDQILELSQKRDLAIREYFEITPSPDHSKIVAQVLSDMSESDKKISHLIEKNKKELVGEGLSLKNNHHAIQQYHYTQAG